MRGTVKHVTILGGSHDGAEYALDGERELRLARLLPIRWESVQPDEPVGYEVEVYGPATEADWLLGRWSLLRTEAP